MSSAVREEILLATEYGRNPSRIRCPECAGERKTVKNPTDLSVTIESDHALYCCHHCDFKGRVQLFQESPVTGQPAKVVRLTETELKWLRARGISPETADKCGLVASFQYFPRSIKGDSPAIGFCYKNLDGSHATKWRAAHEVKDHVQTGAARDLWRISEFKGGDLIITEGELDAVALQEVGIFAVSVPGGASSTGGGKLAYLEKAAKFIATADRIILAGDADDKGRELTSEVSRRVGRHKCWRVRWPDGCKDANDTLVQHGKGRLAECIENVTPWPMVGLRTVREFADEVMLLHEHGHRLGPKTGLDRVDKLVSFCPSAFSIVTGVPGSGKSSWLNWLMVTLAKRSDYKFAIFSAEMAPPIMISCLCALYLERAFGGSHKMSADQLSSAMAWVHERFTIIDDSDTDIISILDRAAAAVMRYGIRGLVIDPFNHLTISTIDSSEDNQVERINALLTLLKRFSSQYDLHVWLVAHPIKMYREGGKMPVPTGYSISGSAAFYNVTDVGVTLSRVEDSNQSVLTNWKARFSHMGQKGQCGLDFNVNTGVYSEPLFEGESFQSKSRGF